MEFFEPNRSPLKILVVTGLVLSAGLVAGKHLAALCFSGAEALVSSAAEAAHEPSAVADEEAEQAARRMAMADAEFDRMTRDIRGSIRRFRGRAHIYLKNLQTGREWTYNADMRVPSASLIKLPVMVGVREKMASGLLKPDHRLVLTRSVRRGGSGQLKFRRNGSRFTVSELLDEMIATSDNTAQEMLIREVGIDYLQGRFAAYGFKSTNITKAGLSLSPRPGAENYTTAREMGRLLDMVYSRDAFGERVSLDILENLKRAKSSDRLRKHMPGSWEIAHKTGLLRKACHDVAVVYSPSGDYILCVLTYGAPSYREAKQFIAKVGAITYRHFDRPAPQAPSAVVASTRSVPSPNS